LPLLKFQPSYINCLLKHVTEGKRERSEGRKGRLKQLPDDLKEARNYRNLKDEALAIYLLENSLCKRPQTCRKTGYIVMTLL